MRKFIQVKNHIHANIARKNSDSWMLWRVMSWSIPMKNHFLAKCAKRDLGKELPWKDMNWSILVKNHTNVNIVKKHLDINFHTKSMNESIQVRETEKKSKEKSAMFFKKLAIWAHIILWQKGVKLFCLGLKWQNWQLGAWIYLPSFWRYKRYNFSFFNILFKIQCCLRFLDMAMSNFQSFGL